MPKLNAVVYKNARLGWDIWVTSEMRQASYDVINFLEFPWLWLAGLSPKRQFGSNPEQYIRRYIQERFSFHWGKHEPEGPSTGGTIVGVTTCGDVIAGTEHTIEATASRSQKIQDTQKNLASTFSKLWFYPSPKLMMEVVQKEAEDICP